MGGHSINRILAATAATVGLMGAAGALPAHAAFDGFFGVNGQEVFNLPSDSWDRHLSAMSRGGLQIVRLDAPWAVAEPQPPDRATGQHRYDWKSFDSWVTEYARHGLRWLPIVSYSSSWSGQVVGDQNSPPARLDYYAAYAAALARRYGRGGSFWREHPELPQLPVTRYELWNEPNAVQFWHPQDRAPELYADLYMAARSALRRVDPGARAIVGGLALVNSGVMSQNDFVERMYRHRRELRGNVDAVGFHPYSPTVADVYGKLREFRQTLARVGAGGVPIEITEVGWTTTNTREQDRAAALARLADELPRSDCNVQGLMPHTWVGGEYNPANPEHWFGIYNRDGTPKESGSAYLKAVTNRRRLGGAPPYRPICSGATAARIAPVLRMRIRRRAGGRGAMLAVLRCPKGCGLTVDVLRPARPVSATAVAGKRLARRSLRFSTGRRTVRVRIAPRRRLFMLRARAVGRSGVVTTRSRLVRRRCRSVSRRRGFRRCVYRAV